MKPISWQALLIAAGIIFPPLGAILLLAYIVWRS